MIKINSDKISEIVIDESFILGLIWKNKDLHIDLDWCGQEEYKEVLNTLTSSKLIFELAYDVKINIDFEDCMGMPDIYEFNPVKKDGFWEIDIKFVSCPQGFIFFKCNDFYFEII